MYYPASKISTNLYTSGKEFLVKSTNAPYQGYYYALSNNKFFTGRTPDDNLTEELTLLEVVTSSDFTTPSPFYPVPTADDYNRNFIIRYFMKKRNEDFTTIVEISSLDYNTNFKNISSVDDTNLYVGLKLNWKISGSTKEQVAQTNRSLVSLKEKVFPGFSLYFKDYNQFYK